MRDPTGDEKTNFALELTYNYGKDGPEAYNIGNTTAPTSLT